MVAELRMCVMCKQRIPLLPLCVQYCILLTNLLWVRSAQRLRKASPLLEEQQAGRYAVLPVMAGLQIFLSNPTSYCRASMSGTASSCS